MHSFNGKTATFNYNGDFSGDIIVSDKNQKEIRFDSIDLDNLVLKESEHFKPILENDFISFSNRLRNYVDVLTEDLRKYMPEGMDINMNDIHLRGWDIIITYKIYCDDEDIEDDEIFEPLLLRMSLRFIEIYKDYFIDLIKKIVSGDRNKLYDNTIKIIKEAVYDKDIFMFFDIIDCEGNILMNYTKLVGSIFD